MKVLSYLHDRDAGRCGLCCGEIPRQKLKSAHIEHIIPKDFVRFVLSPHGEASNGGYYTSKLHGMDNLQLAHPRCNKKKGDTADIYRWRHSEMPHRVAAEAADGRVLMLPPTVSKP
ncbi:MAG: HNH endonuclease [Acidimicrobiaceae bacterium]|nr:HNH endonuclease [Acidimicrobiaceae bacterium]